MNLVHDHSAGAASVSVQCLACAKMVRLADALIDPDGPAFRAYYHRRCAPEGATIETGCTHDGCSRTH